MRNLGLGRGQLSQWVRLIARYMLFRLDIVEPSEGVVIGRKAALMRLCGVIEAHRQFVVSGRDDVAVVERRALLIAEFGPGNDDWIDTRVDYQEEGIVPVFQRGVAARQVAIGVG